VAAGRLLRISVAIYFNGSAVGPIAGSPHENGVAIGEWTSQYPSTAARQSGYYEVLRAPAAGTHTYSFVLTSGPAGTINLLAGFNPCHLTVEDLGPAA
jgi:predicted choloylglycine hydrolase